MVDMQVATDRNKEFVSGKDWYFSNLNRSLMTKFYRKLPANIEDDFKRYNFVQSFFQNQLDKQEILCESEVTYLT